MVGPFPMQIVEFYIVLMYNISMDEESKAAEAVNNPMSIGVQVRGWCRWHDKAVMVTQRALSLTGPGYAYDGKGWHTFAKTAWECSGIEMEAEDDEAQLCESSWYFQIRVTNDAQKAELLS